MELRHLRYFIALGETENFRRAADKLHLAQPALSRQIRSLENEIGVQLLDRLSRGTKLSPAGQAFLDDARQIVTSVIDASERARRIGRGHVGVLRIGFTAVGSTSGIVPESIRTFRSLFPEVQLDLIPLSSIQQEAALHRQEIDAGFLYRSPQSEHDFELQELRVDEALLAVPNGHVLVSEWAPTLASIKGEPFVALQRAVNPHFHDMLTSAFSSAGFQPNVVQETENASFALVLVSVGLGVSIVSSAIGSQCPEGVSLRPIRGLDIKTAFDLAWRKSTRSPMLEAFVEVVTSCRRNSAGERSRVDVRFDL